MLPQTKLDKLPRMADFRPMGDSLRNRALASGTFWSAYCGNRDDAVEGVIDADPIAAAVRELMAARTARTAWTGTASNLLGALAEVAGEHIAKSKNWPGSSSALGGRLRRAATFLRRIGVEIGFDREGRGRDRIIRITATPSQAAPENVGPRPAAPSASSPRVNQANGFAAPFVRTVADGADGIDLAAPSSVRKNPLKTNGGTNADGADANCLPQSGPENRGAVPPGTEKDVMEVEL